MIALLLGILASLGAAPLSAAASPRLTGVRLSKPFFNPTAGQKARIFFSLAQPGKLSVRVLDREGYLVRTLSLERDSNAGEASLEWDGRDDEGRIVPDEAYSLKIDVEVGDSQETYFPARTAAKEAAVGEAAYDQEAGILAYKLAAPSRVRIHATFRQMNLARGGKRQEIISPVVDGALRAAGSVIEHWTGHDETGSRYLPDLPGFRISVLATPLPENSIITFGNREATFRDRIATRRGASLLTSGRTSNPAPVRTAAQ